MTSNPVLLNPIIVSTRKEKINLAKVILNDIVTIDQMAYLSQVLGKIEEMLVEITTKLDPGDKKRVALYNALYPYLKKGRIGRARIRSKKWHVPRIIKRVLKQAERKLKASGATLSDAEKKQIKADLEILLKDKTAWAVLTMNWRTRRKQSQSYFVGHANAIAERAALTLQRYNYFWDQIKACKKTLAEDVENKPPVHTAKDRYENAAKGRRISETLKALRDVDIHNIEKKLVARLQPNTKIAITKSMKYRCDDKGQNCTGADKAKKPHPAKYSVGALRLVQNQLKALLRKADKDLYDKFNRKSRDLRSSKDGIGGVAVSGAGAGAGASSALTGAAVAASSADASQKPDKYAFEAGAMVQPVIAYADEAYKKDLGADTDENRVFRMNLSGYTALNIHNAGFGTNVRPFLALEGRHAGTGEFKLSGGTLFEHKYVDVGAKVGFKAKYNEDNSTINYPDGEAFEFALNANVGTPKYAGLFGNIGVSGEQGWYKGLADDTNLTLVNSYLGAGLSGKYGTIVIGPMYQFEERGTGNSAIDALGLNQIHRVGGYARYFKNGTLFSRPASLAVTGQVLGNVVQENQQKEHPHTSQLITDFNMDLYKNMVTLNANLAVNRENTINGSSNDVRGIAGFRLNWELFNGFNLKPGLSVAPEGSFNDNVDGTARNDTTVAFRPEVVATYQRGKKDPQSGRAKVNSLAMFGDSNTPVGRFMAPQAEAKGVVVSPTRKKIIISDKESKLLDAIAVYLKNKPQEFIKLAGLNANQVKELKAELKLQKPLKLVYKVATKLAQDKVKVTADAINADKELIGSIACLVSDATKIGECKPEDVEKVAMEKTEPKAKTVAAKTANSKAKAKKSEKPKAEKSKPKAEPKAAPKKTTVDDDLGDLGI